MRKILSLLLIVLLVSGCLLMGKGLAWGLNPSPSPVLLSSVDEVAEKQQSGLKLYLDTCAKCHIALPPEVLPMETWQRLLEKPDDHYGTSVKGLIRLTQVLMWDYLRTYSRPLKPDEPMPFYVERSRYFKALHPRVPLPEEVSHRTCITCHPAASQFNFRTLSPE